jgi:hypothetical protein
VLVAGQTNYIEVLKRQENPSGPLEIAQIDVLMGNNQHRWVSNRLGDCMIVHGRQPSVVLIQQA